MPKLASVKNFNQTTSRRDDSDIKSTTSYVSEIMRKKKKIFGINESTLNFSCNASQHEGHSNNARSLTLAPSTFSSKFADYRSPFTGKESDKYADLTKEEIVKIINNNRYHKNNDLSTKTYNSLTGRYY